MAILPAGALFPTGSAAAGGERGGEKLGASFGGAEEEGVHSVLGFTVGSPYFWETNM